MKPVIRVNGKQRLKTDRHRVLRLLPGLGKIPEIFHRGVISRKGIQHLAMIGEVTTWPEEHIGLVDRRMPVLSDIKGMLALCPIELDVRQHIKADRRIRRRIVSDSADGKGIPVWTQF